MGDLIEFTSWLNHSQVFYTFTSGALLVDIKGSGSATIGLGTYDSYCNVWIVIGEENQRSYIEHDNAERTTVHADTPNILSDDEYRAFWVACYGNSVQFGRAGEKQPILTYSPFDTKIRHIMFEVREIMDPVHWKFEIPPKRKTRIPKLLSRGSVEWRAMEGQLPYGAFIGGYEQEEKVYIIRALHEGLLTPGKFIPSKEVALITYYEEFFEKHEFEVLCGYNATWLPVSKNECKIPAGAIVGGLSPDRERTFIGRAKHEGHVILGQVILLHRCCYIIFNESVIRKEDFEILINPDSYNRHIEQDIIHQDSDDGVYYGSDSDW